jgi:signal peptide peptidase SppA
VVWRWHGDKFGEDRLINPRRLLAWLPLRRFRDPPPVVAVVPLNGIIGRFEPWRRGLSLASLAGVIDRAFRLDNLKAVAVTVNSPGGAPVQSALIARRLRALAEEKQVPVFAFAEDVAASGGYWLLCAGDEIFVDPCSIVGSIGVISASFGFPDVLKRVGIERRVYAVGKHKDGLDPFQPEKPADVELLRQVQADIFGTFCRYVEQRRAGKLKLAPE